MIKKIIFIALSLNLVTIGATVGQEITWKAGFNSFFDNREYFNNYAEPGSVLGARIFGEGGFSIDEYNSFSMGIDFMYEFGDETRKEYLKPTLYFHHKKEVSEIYMGAFPRRGIFELPYMLQSDTFQYFRPNVEGIYIRFGNSWGKQDVWLDWTSRQTPDARETFLIGGTGQINKSVFYSRYDFIMYHYAGFAGVEDHQNVRDNGGGIAVVGANLSPLIALDSLLLTTGISYSYDRFRGIYELQNYFGSKTELFAKYKRFGLRNTLYFGDGQVNLVGDKMYTSKFYDRLDLIWDIFKTGPVYGRVEFSIHFLPEVVDVSQKFAIYLDISGKKKLKRTSNIL